MDTGVGNDKAVPRTPLWNMRAGSIWTSPAAGVTPEQVDLVLCTHLHVDHVGWNTRLVDGRWVPTFPHASYVIPGEEWEFWRPESLAGPRSTGCIADSVVPVVEAGASVMVDAVPGGPLLRSSPGGPHPRSLGRAPAHLRGRGVFSGDLMHRVVQVAEPQWSSRFCYDPGRTGLTRKRFRRAPCRLRCTCLPAHFPRPGHIVRDGDGHRFEPVMLDADRGGKRA